MPSQRSQSRIDKRQGYRFVSLGIGTLFFTHQINCGRGNYGRVRTALLVHPPTVNSKPQATTVALKKMKLSNQASAAHEVSATQRLNHPNIIKFLDTFIVEDLAKPTKFPLIIVMDYHKPMREAIRTCYTPTQWIQWMIHIADALIYVHSHTIIHNDVKLDNLLVKCRKLGILADFGIWIDRHDPHPTPSITGGSHCPPECEAYRQGGALRLNDLTKIDAFAYGKTLDSIQDWLNEQPWLCPSKRPTHMQAMAKTLIQRCTAEEPDHRPDMLDIRKTMCFLIL